MEREDRERLVRIEENTKFLRERSEDHARDIEELKSWQNRIKGGLLVLGSLLGIHMKGGQ
jgi:hypothetical protein